MDEISVHNNFTRATYSEGILGPHQLHGLASHRGGSQTKLHLQGLCKQLLFKNAFADTEFSLLYQVFFPDIAGKQFVP